jgi:hypothetical protein
MRKRLLGWATPAAAAALIGGLMTVTSGAGSAGAATASVPAVKFSRMVVVDMQRPGFEPDVKVAPNGTIYSSVPFGFSTTESFVWSSTDHGKTYQLTPGNIGPGKPTTCVGGGDTDLFVDPDNNLYFSDLQGLTNISQSVSSDGGATWSTNCAGVPNTPDDRMWFAGTGSLNKGLRLYEDFDAVDSSASGGNQLVETVSSDGQTFTPVVNSNPTSCTGAAAYDCVSSDEGISGDQVVQPGSSSDAIFIAHNNSNQSQALIAEGTVSHTTPATATWSESPNLNAALCPDPSCTDASGNPEELVGENFVTVAQDQAGYLYAAFTAGPLDHASSSDPNFGALTAPEQVYVVHSLEPATSPGALTWSSPTRVSGRGTNTFPWLVAGSSGRVDVAWYHTPERSEQGTCASGSGTCTLYGAANLTHAEWSVQMGQSLNAHSSTPSYKIAPVSEHPIKYGQICTNGIGCATGGDRSLGDFLQVTVDQNGAADVSYVDDTSADTAAGENAGPEVISHQIGGPSLFASAGGGTGLVKGPDGGPGRPSNSVSDPKGDAYYSANGTKTPATPNLDLRGASLKDGPNNTLIATIKVANLSSLTVSPTLGGPDASWILRWTEVTPGQTGNGHIYYAGMDNNQGAGGSGTPSFFVGDTSCIPGPGNPAEHCKYLTYPQTTTLPASQAAYNPATGVITLNIPESDVGNPAGKKLFSATAFSATSATPQSATTLFNLIDATAPFDHKVG